MFITNLLKFNRANLFIFGIISVLGIVLMLSGLIWDIRIHNANTQLIHEESLVNFKNPGHVMFGAGLFLTIIGVLLSLLNVSSIVAEHKMFKILFKTFPFNLVTLTVFVCFMSIFIIKGSVFAKELLVESPTSKHKEDDKKPGAAVDNHHKKPNYPDIEHATAAEKAYAQRILDESIKNTQKYYDSKVAIKEGYKLVPNKKDVTGKLIIYNHAASKKYRADKNYFDPRYPETLIYKQVDENTMILVGVQYLVAAEYFSPKYENSIIRWHDHKACFDAKKNKNVSRTKEKKCPEGSVEKPFEKALHVWYTKDLKTAYSLKAPDAEMIKYYLTRNK